MDIYETVTIKPMVNQVELNPLFQQPEAVKLMKELNVVPEAWGPFAEGKFGIFTNPILVEIAKNHNKTVGQVILRFNIQRGVVVLPKSVHEERIKENLDVFDFALTEEEIEKIETLDLKKSQIVDHNDPNFIKMLLNITFKH